MMQPVYKLIDNQKFIAQVQRATLTTEEFGILPTHGLFGSQEWWSSIASGQLTVHTLVGTIERVFMGSQNDWPMCAVTSESGERSEWTRQLQEPALDNLYRVGAKIEIDYVWQKHKKKIPGWDQPLEHKQVVEIRICDL